MLKNIHSSPETWDLFRQILRQKYSLAPMKDFKIRFVTAEVVQAERAGRGAQVIERECPGLALPAAPTNGAAGHAIGIGEVSPNGEEP